MSDDWCNIIISSIKDMSNPEGNSFYLLSWVQITARCINTLDETFVSDFLEGIKQQYNNLHGMYQETFKTIKFMKPYTVHLAVTLIWCLTISDLITKLNVFQH